MKDILTEIVAQKQIELLQRKEKCSLNSVVAICTEQKKMKQEKIDQENKEQKSIGAAKAASFPHRSMRQSLAASPHGIIAEFKRRSPSKGWINQSAHPQEIAPAYQEAGAAALSILTDAPYFGGSLYDLEVARPLVELPLLRKEFIIDPYQLYEAKMAQADAVLLIASILSASECHDLAAQAHELGMEVLLEIHHENELTHLNPCIDMLGVNNRHLGTFHTDVNHSFELAKVLPKELLWVSESGIAHPETVAALREVGYRGFLMGENFMKNAHPGEALKAFVAELTTRE
ncbi:MAG: indole-3-glycerol phosphate synthase TrpC [Phocaeicola sp.]